MTDSMLCEYCRTEEPELLYIDTDGRPLTGGEDCLWVHQWLFHSPNNRVNRKWTPCPRMAAKEHGELMRLRAGLPKLADGVPALPGDTVWRHGRPWRVCPMQRAGYIYVDNNIGARIGRLASEFYSTQEAEEAAKTVEPDK